MRWTEDQAAAIDSRGENLLLSAAAGSGKTAVLVERVAKLLLEGADIERMLIVTFTRASAADMKEHLIARLQSLADGGDARLREQAERVDRASISTIHAFCTDFLRAFFQAGEVDPAFRIADGPEVAILREKALQAAMRDHYAAMDADFEALSALRGAQEVHDLALALHAFLNERPDPWGWLSAQIASLEAGEDRYTPELVRAAKRPLLQARVLAKQALELALSEAELYVDTAKNDLQAIEAFLEIEDYTALQLALRGWSWPRLPVKKGESNEQYKALRDSLKELTKKAAKPLAIELSGGVDDLRAAAVELRALGALVRDMDEQLTGYKASRSLLTFNDLEHRTLKALSVPEVQSSIRERFDYVFVDEYQDVSDVQQAILTRVARENNLFCVGDMKQSIYRFRHAEPGLFANQAASYAAGNGGRLIALKANFRSRAKVLEFTNAVFEKAMRGGDTEIIYDEMHRLNPQAAFEGDDPPVEVILCGKQEAGEEAGEAAQALNELKDAEFEAIVAARRIRELIGSPAWDAKRQCAYPLSYRHVVVLTRRAKNVAQHVARVLSEQGIPACADVSGGFFEVLEVRVTLSLLRLIENRQRDLEWISVLRSSAVGLTSPELGLIRAHTSEGSYAQAVLSYAETEQDELALRLRGLIERLDEWRALSHALPVSQLLFTVLRQTGLYSDLGALPGGAQRQANLDMLMSRAEAYEGAQAGGLTGFLRYVEQLSAAQEDMGEAHTLSENDDVVRVMTVHKSKGLEFPVVIGIQLGAALARNRTDLLCAHKALGVGLEHVDNALGARRNTLARLAIEARAGEENYAEALRILYVLLTRARERLILIGTAAKPENRLREAAMCLKEPVFRRDFLDVILPAAMRMPGSGAFWALAQGEAAPEPLPPVLCSVVDRSSLGAYEEREGVSDEEALSRLLAAADAQELSGRFAWVYPHEGETALPGKLTASGLNSQPDPDEEEESVVAQPLEQPAFLSSEAGMTGAQRGTAMHRCLQGLELSAIRGLSGPALGEEIASQADGMTAKDRLTQEERDSLRLSRLVRFFETELGRRLAASRNVRREWLFTLRLSALEATGSDVPGSVLVQGQIDCCFEEDGGWVLLDYKTDRASDPDALAEHYRPQLDLYKKALERITKIPVREAYLCLLSGEEITKRLL